MMSSLVYISFAVEDFPLDLLSKRSWVETFAQQLQVLLTQAGRRDLAVFHTGQQNGAEDDSAAFFLPIVSANYFSSEVCAAERKRFVAENTRIHAIRHISAKHLSIARQLAYHTIDDFFEYDPETELTQEFLNFTWRNDHKYWQKLDDVTERIVRNAAKTTLGTVYVASSSIDLLAMRDAMIRNLKHRGYAVLPEKPLDILAEDLEAQIDAMLRASDLAVHFFGESFGSLIPDTKHSLTSLENEISYACSQKNALQRVLWVFKSTEIMESRQQAYLEYLRTHIDMQQYSFYLETNFEGVKTFIHSLLEKMRDEKLAEKAIPKNAYAVLVYDEANVQVAHLQQHFQAKGLTCRVLNANDPFPYQMRLAANANMVLLYMKHVQADWLKYWERTLLKMLGYRERAGDPAVWLYHEKPLPYKLQGKNNIKHIGSEEEFEKLLRG